MDAEYIKWLENMVIMLSKCYQETHDRLLKKAVKKESDDYFLIVKVQGFDMIKAVKKISNETENRGMYKNVKLNDYVNQLIEEYNSEMVKDF